MKIIPLSEGAFTVDQTKKFVPFDVDKDDLQQRNKGSILVEIQPFVVITSKDIILCDTGLGHADENGQLQIHKNLAASGINSSVLAPSSRCSACKGVVDSGASMVRLR